jgi:hypothetical protein
VVLELGDGVAVGAGLEAWRLRHHFQASMPTPAMAALRRLLLAKVPCRCRRLVFLIPNIVRLLYCARIGISRRSVLQGKPSCQR